MKKNIINHSNFKKTICFYFQVHQPYRLSNYNIFDIGKKSTYFNGPNNYKNKQIFNKVARKCYLPTNKLFLKLLKKYPNFKISFSLSGVFLEQCLDFGKTGEKVLNSFKELVNTGQVELLSETYYHSLAWLFSKKEFAQQIQKHQQLIYEIFKVKPQVFRNTELIYNNEIAEFIRQMGFKGILAEGWDYYLKKRDSGALYTPKKVDLSVEDRKIAKKYALYKKSQQKLTLLLKNYKLSDDIAFRFSNQSWEEWPLTPEKFVEWAKNTSGDTINLFMDYETFGEHQWKDTGIFKFINQLPGLLLKNNIGFKTPLETIEGYAIKDELDVPYLMSWADLERDLSAWCSNEIQNSALNRIFDLENKIKVVLPKIHKEKQIKILDTWRKLQTSDHFYYMCTKYWNDGDVHAYFSPYESPYDAFINYML